MVKNMISVRSLFDSNSVSRDIYDEAFLLCKSLNGSGEFVDTKGEHKLTIGTMSIYLDDKPISRSDVTKENYDTIAFIIRSFNSGRFKFAPIEPINFPFGLSYDAKSNRMFELSNNELSELKFVLDEKYGLHKFEWDKLARKPYFKTVYTDSETADFNRRVNEVHKQLDDLQSIEKVTDVWTQYHIEHLVLQNHETNLKLMEHMESLFSKVNTYNDICAKIGSIPIAKIKSFKTYQNACNFLQIYDTYHQHEIENYLDVL